MKQVIAVLLFVFSLSFVTFAQETQVSTDQVEQAVKNGTATIQRGQNKTNGIIKAEAEKTRTEIGHAVKEGDAQVVAIVEDGQEQTRLSLGTVENLIHQYGKRTVYVVGFTTMLFLLVALVLIYRRWIRPRPNFITQRTLQDGRKVGVVERKVGFWGFRYPMYAHAVLHPNGKVEYYTVDGEVRVTVKHSLGTSTYRVYAKVSPFGKLIWE